MSHTLAAVFTAATTEAETHVVNELPFPPAAFGILALVLWAALLALAWSFRSVGTRHD
ncbi:MAG: hypothetical protein ACK5MT_02810 [Actinomycetales bacterium]